jgi:hypothetical protein
VILAWGEGVPAGVIDIGVRRTAAPADHAGRARSWHRPNATPPSPPTTSSPSAGPRAPRPSPRACRAATTNGWWCAVDHRGGADPPHARLLNPVPAGQHGGHLDGHRHLAGAGRHRGAAPAVHAAGVPAAAARRAHRLHRRAARHPQHAAAKRAAARRHRLQTAVAHRLGLGAAERVDGARLCRKVRRADHQLLRLQRRRGTVGNRRDIPDPALRAQFFPRAGVPRV